MRNCLEVEKTEALFYIYTNSHLFRQRPGAHPISYYGNNIFLEDSDDDGGAFSKTNDDDSDDNNGNGGKGHDGSDGNSSGGRSKHCRIDPLIIPRNLHPEAM